MDSLLGSAGKAVEMRIWLGWVKGLLTVAATGSNVMPFGDEPCIDLAVIAQIRQLEVLRPGLLRRLVEMFECESAQLLLELDTHVAAADLSPLRVRLHSLKGAAASIGARRLSKVVDLAERVASGGANSEPLSKLASTLRAEFAKAQVELSSVVGVT